MSELFEHIDQLRRSSGRVAVATLVNTRGTTPRKEGARMLVDEHGRVLGSVTIGGCVDAQVIEESSDVLGAMKPRLLEMNLGDEEAWEIGLTCGGTIEVFVEPIALDRPSDPTLAYYERARVHADRGGRGALVSLLDDPEGKKLLILDDGRVEGSLGTPALDARFTAEARAAIECGKSQTVVRDDVRAFVEVFAPAALLLVVGAGHVAMALVSQAKLLGYRTVVIDGRPRFATPERFPDVDELKVGIPSELIRTYPLVASTALVLVAHDYKYDIPVLKHALEQPLGYIGMLGSTRRANAILNLVVEDGVSRELLGRVHVPIGLDIGAQTAPEIALAVLAEIQAARAGRSGRPLREVARERAGHNGGTR
ncbi:MAG: XshC-Cox1-family protein [Candidatus Rokuibacteriota bacterium]|nr:MAG: XshC-Cox1-family protein [Candidatus Rokubacteria bacterium]